MPWASFDPQTANTNHSTTPANGWAASDPEQPQSSRGNQAVGQTQPTGAKPLPFMAEKLDSFGRPYYGDGVQGFAKRTFAKFYDPAQYDYKDPQVLAQFDSSVKAAKQDLEQNHSWLTYGAQMLGISSTDIATGITAQNAEVVKKGMEGQTAGQTNFNQITSGLTKAPGVVWDAFTSIIGTTDYTARKVYSFREGIHDAANSAYTDPAKPKSNFEIGVDKGILMNPMGLLYDLGKLGTALVSGKINTEQTGKIINADVAGSQMVYTALTDENKKQEFIRRYNAGENPTLLSEEIQNPWVELIGSVVGDPLTWEGAGIPGEFGKAETAIKIFGKELKISGKVIKLPWETIGRLPTFGDALSVFGVNVGKARLVSEAMKFVEPEKEITKAMGVLKDVSNDEKGLQVLKDAASATVKTIDDLAKNYKPNSLDAAGKAASVGRDATHILRNIISNTGDTEEALQIFSHYDKLFRGTNEERNIAALALSSHDMANVLLSEKGRQTGELIARLYDGGKIQTIINAANGDKVKLAESLFSHFDGVLHDTFASVDDMWKASEQVKSMEKAAKQVSQSGGLITPEVSKLAEDYKTYSQVKSDAQLALQGISKPGTKPSEWDKVRSLAERYQTLQKEQPFVVATRNITRQIDKVHGPIVGTMGNVYISWNPAFFAKNIQGQAIGIMAEFGATEAIAVSGQAIRSSIKSQAEKIISANNQRSLDMLGYIHEASARGFGKGAGLVAESAASRAEQITSSEIVVRTVEREIQKALRSGAIPGAELDALEKSMNGSKDIVIGLLKKYNGNSEKAFNEFRKLSKSGVLEAHRYVEIPEKLKSFMSENHLLEPFQEIQRTAKTKEEFASRVEKLMADTRANVESKLASVPATIGDTVAKETPQLADATMEAQQLHNTGVIDYEKAELFTRVVQSEQNARSSLTAFSDYATGQLGAAIGDKQMVRSMTSEISDVSGIFDKAYGTMNNVRDTVRYIYNDKETSIAELWSKASMGVGQDGKTIFSLKEMYPGVNPETLSRQQFNSLLWNGYYDFAREHWYKANTDLFSSKMDIFNKYAEVAGGKLEEILKPEAGQSNLFETAFKARQEAEQYQTAFKAEDRALANALKDIPKGTSLQDAKIPDLYDFKGGKKRLFNAVNTDRAGKGIAPAATMADVTKEEWAASLAKRIANPQTADTAAKAVETAGQADIASQIQDLTKPYYNEAGDLIVPNKIPPPYNGEMPTYARALYHNLDGFEKDMTQLVNAHQQVWGNVVPLNNFTPETEKALSEFKTAFDGRMVRVKTEASAMATGTRDFLLHSYDKTYLDHALGYLMPFHYWTDRTYLRGMERLIENPGLGASYMKLNDYAEKQNANLPDWWKYNVKVPDLLGANSGNPFYMNIGASLNPMYGLLGTDFNDPYKRADWVSKSVDDLNKFGPTFTPLIQWAVGLHLYNQGNVDAGSRWFGRLFPQSVYVKAALQEGQNIVGKITGQQPDMLNAGKLVQNNEVDPFVNLIEGGLDPYERNRVGRALSLMQQQGVPEEQLLEAARTQSGHLWEQAIQTATTWRAPGNLMASVLGIGLKGRTSADIQIDQFYQEYNQLYTSASTMPPEQYKDALSKLKDQYPFMDTLLLAKKAGPQRDSAYAYNVLGRLPPGQQSEVFKSLGISPVDVAKFYDSKGFTDKRVQFTDIDKQRFMTAVLQMGAMLKMPDSATREEWTQVRGSYQKITDGIARELGKDIWDKVEAYITLKKDKNNSDAADAFSQQHPEVMQALQMKQASVVNNPLVNAYYGGVDTIEAYISGNIREQMTKKYGEDIYAKSTRFYDLGTASPAMAKAYKRQHPELDAFWKESAALKAQGNQLYVQMGSKLPSEKGAQLRSDFTPQPGVQQDLANTIATPPHQTATWQEITNKMPQGLQDAIINYWESGKKLSYNQKNELDYLAQQHGYYNGDDMLRQAGLALNGQGQPQTAQVTQPQQSGWATP